MTEGNAYEHCHEIEHLVGVGGGHGLHDDAHVPDIAARRVRAAYASNGSAGCWGASQINARQLVSDKQSTQSAYHSHV